MFGWSSWRWHMATYHGYREFWMFGLSEEELRNIHRVCFDWCHKPERTVGIEAIISINELRERMGLNEPGR